MKVYMSAAAAVDPDELLLCRFHWEHQDTRQIAHDGCKFSPETIVIFSTLDFGSLGSRGS